MLKRLSLAFAGLFAFVQVALGAGTLPGIGMSQQLDQYGKPLAGGFLYLIAAGTTSTPQNCYQDTALTIAWPNPIVLDAAGRIPQLFCADGNIKVRLTDKNGVQQLVQDNLLVVGASSGSGGGGTVDPTTILATGDIKIVYGTGSLSGFVRANGRTVGSATSGATERANSDVQALFEYLWGADSNLTVSGGRGASAAADWAANKTLTLPDFRGRVIAGLDDMGNSAASRLTSSYFGASGTVLGNAGGSQTHTQTINELAQHRHTATTTNSSSTFNLALNGTKAVVDTTASCCGTSVGSSVATTAGFAQSPSVTIPSNGLSLNTTVDLTGSSDPMNIVQPTILMTYYIKL